MSLLVTNFALMREYVSVATGEIIASERVVGTKDQFFALEKELVDILVSALNLKLARREKTKLRTNPTQSFCRVDKVFSRSCSTRPGKPK